MSLITNRKRPRGFSGTFEANKGYGLISGNDDMTYYEVFDDSPSHPNDSDTNMNQDDQLSFQIDEVNEDQDENDDDDDDVIILEERNLNHYRIKPKRNNSDSILFFDTDSVNAFKLLNVNNQQATHLLDIDTNKKQRKNSLPQLPQVKCNYNYIIGDNAIANSGRSSVSSSSSNGSGGSVSYKLGNIKPAVIPYNLNAPPCLDKDGHFIIELNSLLANRFMIIRLLGQGTFGKVVKCYDKINRDYVAIKIIRNIPKYRDAAKIELRILATLKKFDNKNLNHCLHLRECFDYRGHICIVTDLLKISLYDFLENNRFIPFPGSHIQAIAKQVIRSVTFLHDLNLIHTDLKPENILLYDDGFNKKSLVSKTLVSAYVNLSNINDFKKVPKVSRILNNPLIQIIDFGSAIFNDEYHSSIVSTRHYRAPEIVLGIGWSFPCDMWSIGCILVELIIGEPLFKTHDNLEHLAMIEKFVGYRFDKSIIKKLKLNDNECGVNYFTNELGTHRIKPYHNKPNQQRRSSSIRLSQNGNMGSASDPITLADQLEEAIDDEEIEDDFENNAVNTDGAMDDEEDDQELRLIFPTSDTPSHFITNVNQLDRIDLFISKRIGLRINFDYSLNYNYEQNKHLINFGNFTFWWFLIDLLKNLFIINPNNRLTAEEAMNHPWFNLGVEDEGTV